MALKPCLDCGTLTPNTRCPPHQTATLNQRYANRGTTKQRGLSGQHARISNQYKQTNRPCECTGCGWHTGPCGLHGTPNNPITAGHLNPRTNGGTSNPTNYRPECRRCNSSLGARGTAPGGTPPS